MNKLQVARALLQRGPIFVHVCPFHNSFDVQLPLRLKNKRHLVLQVGFDMPVPIPDLFFNDKGWGGTLSFDRVSFYCYIPWECVVALGDERGMGISWDESTTPYADEPIPAEPLKDNVVSLADFKAKKVAK